MKRWQARGRITARRIWKHRQRLAFIAGAFLVFALFLGWGGGVPGRPESWSAVWHYPVLSDALESLAESRLPFWHSRLALGYPVWAAGGEVVTNPLLWPFLGLEADGVLQAAVVLFALVATGAFLWQARQAGFPLLVGSIGAIVYGGSSQLVGSLFSGSYDVAVVASAFPLALGLLSSRGDRAGKMLAGAALGAWIALSAGFISLMVVLVGAGLALRLLPQLSGGRNCRAGAGSGGSKRGDERVRPTAFLPAALLLSLAIGAVIILPRLEYWRLTVPVRLPQASSPLLPFLTIIEGAVPGLFGPENLPRWAGDISQGFALYIGLVMLLPAVVWPAASPAERTSLKRAAMVAGVILGICLAGRLFSLTASLRSVAEVVFQLGMFALAWLVMIAAVVLLRVFPDVRRRGVIIFAAAAGAFLIPAVILSLISAGAWRSIFEGLFGRSEFHSLLDAGFEPEFRRRWLGTPPEQVVSWLAPQALSHSRAVLFQQALMAAVWTGFFWGGGRARRFQEFLPEALAVLVLLDLTVASRHLRHWTSSAHLRPPAALRATPPDARVAIPQIPALRNAPLPDESGSRAALPGAVPRVLANAAESWGANPFLHPERALYGKPENPGGAVRQLGAFGATHLYWTGPVADWLKESGLSLPAGPAAAGAENDGDFVAALPHPAPRVRGVAEVLAVEGREAAVGRLLRPGFDWQRTVVATESMGLPGEGKGGDPRLTAQVTAEPPNRLEIRAHSSEPAVLVLTDAFYPGWKAEVNGRPARVREINGWLRGVTIREGSSFVRMRFQPFSVRLGLFLSLLGGAVWTGLAMKYLAGRRRRP